MKHGLPDICACPKHDEHKESQPSVETIVLELFLTQRPSELLL